MTGFDARCPHHVLCHHGKDFAPCKSVTYFLRSDLITSSIKCCPRGCRLRPCPWSLVVRKNRIVVLGPGFGLEGQVLGLNGLEG